MISNQNSFYSDYQVLQLKGKILNMKNKTFNHFSTEGSTSTRYHPLYLLGQTRATSAPSDLIGSKAKPFVTAQSDSS